MPWNPFKPGGPAKRSAPSHRAAIAEMAPKSQPKPKEGYFFYTLQTMHARNTTADSRNITTEPTTVQVPLPNDDLPPYFSVGFYDKGNDKGYKVDFEHGLDEMIAYINFLKKCKPDNEDYAECHYRIKLLASEFSISYACRKEHMRYDLAQVAARIVDLSKHCPAPEWNQMAWKVTKQRTDHASGRALRKWEQKMAETDGQIKHPGQ
ncbi:MAG: hypothetical protein Q9222_001971 [Ikaeria aurantiellina]